MLQWCSRNPIQAVQRIESACNVAAAELWSQRSRPARVLLTAAGVLHAQCTFREAEAKHARFLKKLHISCRMHVNNSKQHCCHPPSSAATCSNAMHSGLAELETEARRLRCWRRLRRLGAAPQPLGARRQPCGSGVPAGRGRLRRSKTRLLPANMSRRPLGTTFCSQSGCTQYGTISINVTRLLSRCWTDGMVTLLLQGCGGSPAGRCPASPWRWLRHMLCWSRCQHRRPLQMQRQASRRAWRQLLLRMCRRCCGNSGTPSL